MLEEIIKENKDRKINFNSRLDMNLKNVPDDMLQEIHSVCKKVFNWR